MSIGGRREFPQREQPVPRPKYGLCPVRLGNRVVVSEVEQKSHEVREAEWGKADRAGFVGQGEDFGFPSG